MKKCLCVSLLFWVYVIYPCIDKAYFKHASWNSFGKLSGYQRTGFEKIARVDCKKKMESGLCRAVLVKVSTEN